MKAEGIELPNKAPPARSNFHIGQDDEKLKAMFKEAGFDRLVTWHQMSRWGCKQAFCPIGCFASFPSLVLLCSEHVSSYSNLPTRILLVVSQCSMETLLLKCGCTALIEAWVL